MIKLLAVGFGLETLKTEISTPKHMIIIASDLGPIVAVWRRWDK